MGHPSYPTPPPVPAFTPPANSIVSGTSGPQYKKGQTPPGANTNFQILAVRPKSLPSPVALAPTGPQVPPGQKIPPGDKAGAGPGSDTTRGLLKKPGTGRTLLT